MPVVLYGCETRLLALREKCRLRVFENRVLRRKFEPKRDDVTRGKKKLHKEELSDLYSSPSIIRVIKSKRMKWAGLVVPMGESRGVCRVLVGRHKGKRRLGRPRLRWEYKSKMENRLASEDSAP